MGYAIDSNRIKKFLAGKTSSYVTQPKKAVDTKLLDAMAFLRKNNSASSRIDDEDFTLKNLKKYGFEPYYYENFSKLETR